MSSAVPTRVLLVASGPTAILPSLAEDLRDRLAARGVETTTITPADAHGEPPQAAAPINAILANSDADVAAVVFDGTATTADELARLVESCRSRPGLAVAGPATLLDDWTRAAGGADFASALAEASARVFVRNETIVPLPFVSALAVDRKAFNALGGLDERLAGVGDVLDLALRALDAGVPMEMLSPGTTPPLEAQPPAHAAYTLLAWRNAALIALRQPDPERAGALLGHVATLAVASAWKAAGLDPSALRFGGDWARQTPLDRLLSRTGVARNSTFWPRDEVGTLVPLLGLDAALEMLAGGG